MCSLFSSEIPNVSFFVFLFFLPLNNNLGAHYVIDEPYLSISFRTQLEGCIRGIKGIKVKGLVT